MADAEKVQPEALEEALEELARAAADARRANHREHEAMLEEQKAREVLIEARAKVEAMVEQDTIQRVREIEEAEGRVLVEHHGKA